MQGNSKVKPKPIAQIKVTYGGMTKKTLFGYTLSELLFIFK